MRWTIAIITFVLMAYPVCASAVTGVAFGGKVGYAKYTGDILPASGDVGNSMFYGAVLEVTTMPIIDLEMHVNYFEKSFAYGFDVGGVPVQTEFDFRDLHVIALAKKNFIPVPMSPVGLYLGAGLGLHILNTEVAANAAANPQQADDPVALVSNSAKYSGHGMVGVKLSPPVAPLAVYGEARFGRIFADNAINTTQVEAGLLFKF